MASYGNIFQFTILSQNGDDVDIFISKKNYSGPLMQRPLGRAPILKREANGNILGTSLEIYAECRSDQEYAGLYTSSADEFLVELYKNRVLQWTGFISPELYAEPDLAPPYDVQIIATDGLGELKNYAFTQEDNRPKSYLGHLRTILQHTGSDLEITTISSLQYSDDEEWSGNLLSIVADFGHLTKDNAYNALQTILASVNATITQQAGKWLIVRSSDIYDHISELNPVQFGSMNICDWWPIGNLSTDIIPAKRHLILTSSNAYKPTVLQNSLMESDESWVKEFGARYDDNERAFILPAANSGIVQSVSLEQEVGYQLFLRISARNIGDSQESQVLGVSVKIDGRTYQAGNQFWLTRLAGFDSRYVWRNYEGYIEIDLPEPSASDTRSDASNIDIVIPLYKYDSRSYAYATAVEVRLFNPAGLYDIGIYECSLMQYAQTAGKQIEVAILNNARENANAVELGLGDGDYAFPAAEVFRYALPLGYNSESIIRRWRTSSLTESGYLPLMARDYAVQVAKPRIRYRGKLNVPSSALPNIPLLFQRDNTYYILNTYAYDLLLDEIEVELISIPNATVAIESERVEDIASGAAMSNPSGGSAGGEGSGGSSGSSTLSGLNDVEIANLGNEQYLKYDSLLAKWVNKALDDKMSEESTNAVQNKVIKKYIDSAIALYADKGPSLFLGDMASIVAFAGQINRQTREQLYSIFLYTEGKEIPSEAQWVIDTNGQHYIVRMLETETGVGFFILGYEGFTRIEGDNTKTNQLLRDKADKKYVDGTFFSQAQFDSIASNQYTVGNVAYQTDSDTGLRRLSLSLGLRIQNDIDAAVNDRPDDNGNYTNGLATALGVKNWVENKGYLTSSAMENYATKDEIKNFVSTSGGTITGALTVNGNLTAGLNILLSGALKMSNGRIEGVNQIIHYYPGAYNIDEYGNFYAPSDATDSSFWGFRRADKNNALTVYAESGKVEIRNDAHLARYGGVVSVGNQYNKGDVKVHGTLYVCGDSTIFEDAAIEYKKTSDGLNKLVISRRVNMTGDVYVDGLLTMNSRNIEGVAAIIHKYPNAYNIDQYGNFYAPSTATDSSYWNFKRADGKDVFRIFAGTGTVETSYDTTLGRNGGATGCTINMGTAYNRANTNVYGDFKVIGYPAEFKNGITLGGKTITSWSDFITSDGGTINAGKYLNIGSASLAYKAISPDYLNKLVISGLVSIGNLYMRERLYIEASAGLDARIAFRDSNGTITDYIDSFDDLRIKVVERTETSGVSIAPNVLNKWTTPLTDALTINFSAGRDGVANYYMMEFTTGATVPTITLPSGITWQGGDNILSRLEPNKTYQISVLNNLAVGGAF